MGSCVMASPFSSLRMLFERLNPSTAGLDSTFVEETLSNIRAMNAKIESPSKVRGYLDRYPEITEILSIVSEQVYQYFDYKAQLYLNINDDDGADSEYLALYLRVSNYDESVMHRIEKIQKDYYPLLDNATGWFLFTTDFLLPEVA
jgi:hypothetical protein